MMIKQMLSYSLYILAAILTVAVIYSCEKEPIREQPFDSDIRYAVLNPVSLPMQPGRIRLFKGSAVYVPEWTAVSTLDDGSISVSFEANLRFGVRRDTLEAVMDLDDAVLRVPLAQSGFSTLTESDCLLVEDDLARINVLTEKAWQIRPADGAEVLSAGEGPGTACFPAKAGEKYYFDTQGLSIPLAALRREEIRQILVPSEGGTVPSISTGSRDSFILFSASWVSDISSAHAGRISVSPSVEPYVREAVLTVTDMQGNVKDRILIVQNTGAIENLREPGVYKAGKALLLSGDTVIEKMIRKDASTEFVFTDGDGVMDFFHLTIDDADVGSLRLGQKTEVRLSGLLYSWSRTSAPATVIGHNNGILCLSLEDGTIMVLHA